MSTYVRPEGDLLTAKVVLVGEQPGKTEVQTGRPFIGASGRELNDCLRVIDLPRTDCYITNFAKDLDHHVSTYLNLKSGTYNEKGIAHRKVLMGELKQCKANVIVAIGQYALAAISGILSPGITKWRGSVLTSDELEGKFIVPTIHPATILPPKMQYLNKFLIQLDLKKAKQIAENGFERKHRDLRIKPSYTQAIGWLDQMNLLGNAGEIVYFDIELYNEEVSCISFAVSDDEVMSIPFVGWNGSYYSAQEEVTIWKYIARILENPKVKKCGQNVSFDSHFLLRRYGINTVNLEDTMIAQHTLMPDYPKGLDFITSVWTDHKYYKDEGKKYFSGGGWEQLWKYNATDSIICAEALPKQKAKLEVQGNIPCYKEKCRLLGPLIYMQERGIKCNVEGFKREALELTTKIDELQEQLNQQAGQILNANSPKQLKEYFYGHLKFRPYKSRMTGGVTTDSNAMKRIARQGNKEAQIILDICKHKKLVSTYLNLDKIDPDGRIRCSYNPVGTKFSRLSSSANIFGTGMNMQNWPHSLHKYLLFDDDYVGYRMDLSQAENRIVAYEGNITPMIECFESGKDVHSLTAALILGKGTDEISREEGSCYLGDGSHSERDWGKKANHGLNYDLGYKSFALIFEMPEKQALYVVNRYHLAYPGVRNTFHANVKASLKKDRTVTNLMGRRTLFMDQWGDKLFKEAFSCIPQGTVGDIMDKRCLNYIYYGSDFEPVELLLQVHDDGSFQIPRSVPLKEHARLLLKIKAQMETPLMTSWGQEFVIPVDTVVCPRSFSKEEGEEIKSSKMPNDVDLLAKELERILNESQAR